MKSWTRAWAGAVVPLLLAVPAGCAGEETTPVDEPASRRSTATGAPVAVTVRLVVTGGIAGTHEVFTVTRDDADGAQARRVARILALAGDPAVRGFASPHMRGPARCCDLRMFEIAVRYGDGSSTRIKTPETRTGPPELRRLVSLLSATG